ncbi:phosphatases II [Xylaria nigripes]|nr:phosphatases II [Xylaria nigripes]
MCSEAYVRAQPTVPYTNKPPSPPHISIPIDVATNTIKIVPLYDNVDPVSLSDRDLSIITQNYLEQVAQDSASTWIYESRRAAQPILDYLYLGPSSVVRNHAWLLSEGITMILAVRDTRQAGLNFMAIDKVAEELGIEARYVDVSGYQELIRAFPSAVQMINDHMLRIHQSQTIHDNQITAPLAEDMVLNQHRVKRGKVLVFCETGNGRSASIVTAYMMSVLGINLERAYQFVNFKRFCVSMDEDLKRTLKSYEDILLAQRTVHQQQLSSHLDPARKSGKRGIEETIDHDGDDDLMTGADSYASSDQDRFLGRNMFVPFVDY